MGKVFFLQALLCFCMVCTAAQYEGSYLVTTRDGLSNSSVNHMMMDNKGLLWISTWDGVNVYNGRNVKVFRSDPGDPFTLQDNIVWFTFQEDERYYWVVTDSAVNRYDSTTGKFSRYRLSSDSGNPMSGGKISMSISEDGMVFCASRGWGIAMYDRAADRMVPFNISGMSASEISGLFCVGEQGLVISLVDGSVVSVRYEYRDGEMDATVVETLIHASEQIYHSVSGDNALYFHGAEKVFRWDCLSERMSDIAAFSKRVSWSMEAPDGNLYCVSGRSQVYSIDFVTGQQKLVPDMCRNNLLCFYFGPEDIKWLAVDGVGLEACYTVDSTMARMDNSEVYGTNAGAVTSMVQLSDGDIYVSTLGNGLYALNADGKLKGRKGESVIGNNQIFSMERGPDDLLFLGLPNKVEIFDRSKNRAYDLASFREVAYCMYFDKSKNQLWIGTLGNGVISFDLEYAGGKWQVGTLRHFVHSKGDNTSLSSGNIMHIAPCDSTHMWVGTLGGGLNLMETLTGRSVKYVADANSADMSNARYIYPEKEGSIWVGTSYGICHGLADKDGHFSFTSYSEGLENYTIHSIMKDDMGRLWMSTNGGISCFDPESSTFTNISGSDMLQAEEFYIHSCMTTSSGEMYFGGVSGLNHFYPGKIHLRDYSPKIILESFTIRLDNVRHVFDGAEIKLKHNENFFNIGFSALEYIENSNCEYSYILEGFNNEWITSGGGTAIFTNVPPGTYVFRVRSTNGDKVWCDNEALLNIIVEHPWWLTWWAYMLYALFIAGGAVIAHTLYRQRIRERHLYDLEVHEKCRQKEQYEAKLNFFTNIAHEFGTPLTLISCSGEQLSSGLKAGSKESRYVGIINDNAARMQRLIQELLEFRKVESGYYDPIYERLDPAAMLGRIMGNFQDVGARHAISSKLVLPEEKIDFICDYSALEKIMTNLISNAYKYTPDGGEVDVRLENADNGIRCVVSNTSKGLSQEKLAHVFDRFVILDTFERQMAKGKITRNGLGTALVNSLVKTLGGRISVDSVMEKSVTFEFWLPSAGEEQLAAYEGNSNMPSRQSESVPLDIISYEEDSFGTAAIQDDSDKPLVMIVDDDLQVCDLVAEILSQKYRVMKAVDGQAALEMVEIERPDLIITDMDMPNLNGMELLKHLKKNELTKYIPVVFLAFKADVDSEVNTYNLGSEAFIHKPFLPQQLTAIVGSIISKRRSLKDYYKSAASEMDLFQGLTLNSKEKEFISAFIHIVEENILDDLSPAVIAEKMCISEMTLYRRIKEYVGKRPSEFIRGIKLNKAAHLLKTTDRTVQEIMFDCGFNNKSYFYRTFSNLYGMSPKEYRRS